MRNAWMSIFLVLIITFNFYYISFEIENKEKVSPNNSNPLLVYPSAQVFFSRGSGTESDPYRIYNVAQLQDINENHSAHYILVNDIDASETRLWNGGKGFLPIGELISPSFIGGVPQTIAIYIFSTCRLINCTAILE